MPIYDYRCECGIRFTRLLKLANYKEPQLHTCGTEVPALKVIVAPSIQADYPPYECPVSGRLIEGRKAHLENLKRTGCRLYEPGETGQQQRIIEESDKRLEQALEATADEFITQLPLEKKEKLAAEMSGGLDVAVERSSVTF